MPGWSRIFWNSAAAGCTPIQDRATIRSAEEVALYENGKIAKQLLPCYFEVKSLSPDGEIYGNAGLSFDGLTGLQVRPESPFFHGVPCRSRKNRGSAE
jgi:hypothetical protein